MSVTLSKPSDNIETITCETIGCREAATHTLAWRERHSGLNTLWSEKVCEPCGQGYVSRPSLRATLKPLT